MLITQLGPQFTSKTQDLEDHIILGTNSKKYYII